MYPHARSDYDGTRAARFALPVAVLPCADSNPVLALLLKMFLLHLRVALTLLWIHTRIIKLHAVVVYKHDRTCGGQNVEFLSGSVSEYMYHDHNLAQCMQRCQGTAGCRRFGWGAGGCRISSKICTKEYLTGAKIYQLAKGTLLVW